MALYLTGIHDARQLSEFDPSSWTGRRRRIAIDLVDDIDRLGDASAREALFERIVDARGAFKRTYRDRFAAFDAALLAAWNDLGWQGTNLHVLDAAVSDGSTALPLFAAFDRIAGDALRFTATDLDGRYIRLSRPGEPARRVIVNEVGAIVQIVIPPFLFTHRESRFLFPVNRMLRCAAERWAAPLVEAWGRGTPPIAVREILLFNPQFRQVVENDGRLEFTAWDILQPWNGKAAHCVRAMNVLNPGYFDGNQMRQAVRHLFDAVCDGGLLALGSNEDAGTTVDGVICRRDGQRLVVITTMGHGFRAPEALAPLLASDR